MTANSHGVCVKLLGFISEALKRLRGKMSNRAEDPTDPETGAGGPGVEGQGKAEEAEGEAAVQVNTFHYNHTVTTFSFLFLPPLFSLRLKYLNTNRLTRRAKKPDLSAASSNTARNDANREKKRLLKKIKMACPPRAFYRRS